eukprot:COSAG02_NODE_2414_length_8913_cov_9.441116_1_plen_64_part_10
MTCETQRFHQNYSLRWASGVRPQKTRRAGGARGGGGGGGGVFGHLSFDVFVEICVGIGSFFFFF